MKKILLFFLFSCLSVTLSLAQEITTINNIKYYLNSTNNEASVLEQSSSLSGSITIPEEVTYNDVTYRVTSLADKAFKSTDITSITLPSSIVSLGEECFNRCSGLTSITLPNSITSIGNSCFWGCSNLSSVTLPNSITSISDNCFRACGLKSITIPNSVTSLGFYCFESSGLTSITLPEGVTTLGERSLSCHNLTSVELPNTLTTIGDGCFYGAQLTSITLPNSVTSMGNSCFSNCQKLRTVTLSNALTSLDSYTFSGCTDLRTITLPSSITSLGTHCFWNSGIKSITLPNGITSLGEDCFGCCDGLTSIELPSSITDLGSEGFYKCTNLAKVTCHWKDLNVLYTTSDVFTGIFSEATLYVPKGTKSIYQAEVPWSTFTSIIEMDEETGEPVEVKQCEAPQVSYEKNKLTFSCGTSGAEYHYSIADDDIKTSAYSANGEVELTETYKISVYATADGYKNSETTEATLCFVNATLSTNIENATTQRALIVSSNAGLVTVSGLNDGESVELYDLSGKLVSTGKATAGTAQLDARSIVGVAVLKINGQGIKIEIK